jgi:hypothetical protein
MSDQPQLKDNELRDLEQPRMLMLTCAACGEYHEASYYKDYCERCQAGRKEGDLMTVDYWNRFTQTEKQEEVEHDTYLRRAEAAIELEAAGRFKARQEMRLTGQRADPIPRQPENSPWSQPDRNVEPPFDVDINAVEPILPESPNADPAGNISPAVERREGEEGGADDGIAAPPSTHPQRPATFQGSIGVAGQGGSRTHPASSYKFRRRF